MSFVSAMIFMIFILVSLGFGSSSFFSCLSCTVSLLIWDLPCFLRKDCIVINTPFRTVFATYWGFPCGESNCSAGDLGSMPGLERPTGKGKSYPVQYSGLENSIVCVGHRESDMTEWLSHHIIHHIATYYRVWIIMLSFSFVSILFLISYLISSVIHLLFNVLFSFLLFCYIFFLVVYF